MTSGTARSLSAAWLDRMDYASAWRAQNELFEARLQGDCGDAVMLLEHPPTYTLGRRAEAGDLVYGDMARSVRGIALHRVDRGGRATYHGPGQLVGYPILALGERYDVLRYLRKLEEVLIRTAASLGVTAGRDPEHTGVWIGRNKIGAIGVRITRGITMHGFAFNVGTDLEMYEGIVPCGIRDRGVTSIEAETGTRPALRGVAEVAAAHLADVFDRRLIWTQPSSLMPVADGGRVPVPT